MGKKELILVVLLLTLVACTPQPDNTTMNLSVLESDIIQISTPEDTAEVPDITGEVVYETENKPEEVKVETVEIPEEYADITVKKFAIEGETIELKPQAIDYDGDEITYSFSEPFDDKGSWVTTEGDAGFYKVTITASDGKDTTSQDVLVVLLSSNKAPVLTCPEEISLKEGEDLFIECDATDNEGDDLVFEYSGWAASRVKMTGYNDAGTHMVYVTASDGKKSTKATIKVIVEDKNRLPVVKEFRTIRVTEGEMVKVVPEVTDEDTDDLTITFGDPLDENGEWETRMGDDGVYTAEVRVSDGKAIIEKTVEIVVGKLNSPPVLEEIADITVEEGETVRILAFATDPDGDDVVVRVIGWMDDLEYTTTYSDAGEYDVTVTASDGTLETSQDVHITVEDRNRPPVFRIPV
ncbi:MAG: hypothetical protein KKG59_03185 [Nanoarchaeota archaeon]|nr:hypothetical protein [Nanoarchaeota archaeon]